MDEDILDEDIYGDLPNLDLAEECERLEGRVEELELKTKDLGDKIEALNLEKTKLSHDNRILKKNISILMKTAKLEVQRKDKLISELRSDKGKQYFPRVDKRDASTMTDFDVKPRAANLETQIQTENFEKKPELKLPKDRTKSLETKPVTTDKSYQKQEEKICGKSNCDAESSTHKSESDKKRVVDRLGGKLNPRDVPREVREDERPDYDRRRSRYREENPPHNRRNKFEEKTMKRKDWRRSRSPEFYPKSRSPVRGHRKYRSRSPHDGRKTHRSRSPLVESRPRSPHLPTSLLKPQYLIEGRDKSRGSERNSGSRSPGNLKIGSEGPSRSNSPSVRPSSRSPGREHRKYRSRSPHDEKKTHRSRSPLVKSAFHQSRSRSPHLRTSLLKPQYLVEGSDKTRGSERNSGSRSPGNLKIGSEGPSRSNSPSVRPSSRPSSPNLVETVQEVTEKGDPPENFELVEGIPPTETPIPTDTHSRTETIPVVDMPKSSEVDKEHVYVDPYLIDPDQEKEEGETSDSGTEEPQDLRLLLRKRRKPQQIRTLYSWRMEQKLKREAEEKNNENLEKIDNDCQGNLTTLVKSDDFRKTEGKLPSETTLNSRNNLNEVSLENKTVAAAKKIAIVATEISCLEDGEIRDSPMKNIKTKEIEKIPFLSPNEKGTKESPSSDELLFLSANENLSSDDVPTVDEIVQPLPKKPHLTLNTSLIPKQTPYADFPFFPENKQPMVATYSPFKNDYKLLELSPVCTQKVNLIEYHTNLEAVKKVEQILKLSTISVDQSGQTLTLVDRTSSQVSVEHGQEISESQVKNFEELLKMPTFSVLPPSKPLTPMDIISVKSVNDTEEPPEKPECQVKDDAIDVESGKSEKEIEPPKKEESKEDQTKAKNPFDIKSYRIPKKGQDKNNAGTQEGKKSRLNDKSTPSNDGKLSEGSNKRKRTQSDANSTEKTTKKEFKEINKKSEVRSKTFTKTEASTKRALEISKGGLKDSPLTNGKSPKSQNNTGSKIFESDSLIKALTTDESDKKFSSNVKKVKSSKEIERNLKNAQIVKEIGSVAQEVLKGMKKNKSKTEIVTKPSTHTSKTPKISLTQKGKKKGSPVPKESQKVNKKANTPTIIENSDSTKKKELNGPKKHGPKSPKIQRNVPVPAEDKQIKKKRTGSINDLFSSEDDEVPVTKQLKGSQTGSKTPPLIKKSPRIRKQKQNETVNNSNTALLETSGTNVKDVFNSEIEEAEKETANSQKMLKSDVTSSTDGGHSKENQTLDKSSEKNEFLEETLPNTTIRSENLDVSEQQKVTQSQEETSMNCDIANFEIFKSVNKSSSSLDHSTGSGNSNRLQNDLLLSESDVEKSDVNDSSCDSSDSGSDSGASFIIDLFL